MKILLLFTQFTLFISLHGLSQSDSILMQKRKFIAGRIDFRRNIYIPDNPLSLSSKMNNVDSKFSFGKFKGKDLARLFNVGLIIGVGADDSVNSPSNNSSYGKYGLSIGYSLEKYKMLSSKVGLFAGIEGNIAYQVNTINSNFRQYSSSVVEGNTVDSKSQKDISIIINGYPGIIFFINTQWALILKVGNLNLFNISYTTTDEKSLTVDNTNIISESHTSGTNLGYGFSPSFSINNSGIGIRYFLK